MALYAPNPPTPSIAQVIQRGGLFMLSGNGWRAPTQRYVPGAGALSQVSEFVYISDPYWTFAPRYLFANWYLTTSSAGAQEAANGNAVTIGDLAISVNGGARTRLKFSGATGVVLADDAEVWSDADPAIAIPPNAVVRVAVERTVANSALFVSAPSNGYSPMMGYKSEVSATSLAAKVMAGGVSTAVPTGNNAYQFGPIACVAQGWDGRPVILGLGTSIAQGVGSPRYYRNSKGEIGPMGMGLASQYDNAPRFPSAIWAISGGFAAGIAGSGLSQGLGRRARAIAAISSAQGGALPFTTVLSDFGTNDQTATLATWITAMETMWAACRSLWPTARLGQQGLLSRVTSTDGFTTVANQTLSSNWSFPAGSAWGLREHMAKLALGNIDYYVDVQDDLDNYLAGGTRGKWRADILSGWSTTLSASRSGAETSMTLAAQPPAYSALAILDGTNEAVPAHDYPSTAAPFTVNFLGAIAGAHTAGATVKQALTIDGVHPGLEVSAFIADRIYARHKLAGTFG